MSAHDTLNTTQFLPIEQVGAMKSTDFSGMTLEQTYQLPRGPRTMFFSTRNPGNTYKGKPITHEGIVYSKSGKSVYHPPIMGDDGKPTNRMRKQRELEASVAEHGVQKPLEVSHYAPGDDNVTQGHHRYWAGRKAGLTHLPVEVADWT